MSDKMGNEEQRSNSPIDKKWVQFDENNDVKRHVEPLPSAPAVSNYNGAVIDTETVQIDIDKLKQLAQSKVPEAEGQHEDLQKTVIPTMRNVSLDDVDGADNLATVVDPSISRGFCKPKLSLTHLYSFIQFRIFYSANGDVIVTVLPVNQKWPWITPAEFRPELVPEELMAEGLSVRFFKYLIYI
jgi:hypothetical protein